MLRILEDGIVYLWNPIRYLIGIEEDIYLSRCGERLAQQGFNDELFEYLDKFRPANYSEILRACYLTMKARSDKVIQEQSAQSGSEESDVLAETLSAMQATHRVFPTFTEFRPLLNLMCADDDWAWTEFSARLSEERVPVQAERPTEFFGSSSRRFTITPSRLPIFADWYAFVRRNGGEDWDSRTLFEEILKVMVLTDKRECIRELRQLQRDNAFPDSRFLSSTILEIEDQALNEGVASWEAGQLLDFLNKENLGVINDERDLFEWVCQGIESLKDDIEKRAEGVVGFWDKWRLRISGKAKREKRAASAVGFWDGMEPKTEPDCQNVLWPRLQSKMKEYGITVALGEEGSIGANWCDFWVDYPRASAEPFRVRIELKTARKGYGRAELVDPIESQLWDRYLRPSNCRHGLYVVLWFRNAEYEYPKQWNTPDELHKELRAKCEGVSLAHSVNVLSYVIDLTTPSRRRP